jgi:ABC-type sugar transport system ATPase subunit
VVDEYVKKVNIKARSRTQRVTFLSGGNQQKVLLSKCLATKPKILFAIDPTRGIDVGSKAEIHKILNTIAGEGVGIILISSEIDELTALSDRIIVLNGGRIGEVIDQEHFDGRVIRLSMHKKTVGA